MKEIAYRDWARYEHAEFFSRVALPFLSMQYTLDMTHFRQYTKDKGISFYFGLIWASTKVLEAREDFRWRLRGEKVVLIDHPVPSFTDLATGSELFKIVNVPIKGDDMAVYACKARQTADAQTHYFPSDAEEAGDGYTYFSSMPAAVITALSQAMDTNRNDFVPAIAWGSYYEESGRYKLPYVMKFNHRLADGFHACRYFNELQVFIDALD